MESLCFMITSLRETPCSQIHVTIQFTILLYRNKQGTTTFRSYDKNLQIETFKRWQTIFQT